MLLQALEGRCLWSTVSVLAPIANVTPTVGAATTLNLRNHFATDSANGTTVRLNIEYGLAPTRATVDIGLFDAATPRTVANFLNYVDSGRFNGTFFHRAIAGFVLQGGNFTYDGVNAPTEAETDAPVVNEFATSPRDSQGRVNTRGTLAMAKLGGDPNSATNQFFFNVADNSSNLDNQNGGFTTFASVLGSGLTAVDAILALNVINAGGAFDTLPVADFTSGNLAPNQLVTLTTASVLTPGITFSVVSSNPSVVSASVVGNVLTLTPSTTAGTSNIRVTATDRDGASLIQTFTYTGSGSGTAVQTPGVSVSVPSTIAEGSSGTVTLSNPTNPGGQTSTLTYSYDFDNDGTFEVTGSSALSAAIPASFLADGPVNRSVRVRVTNTGGGFADVLQPYSVTNVPPTAAFTAPTQVGIGQSITLTAAPTDPSPTDTAAGFSYVWSVTRGAVSVAQGTGPTISFTASEAGAYSISLTVRDKENASSTVVSKTLTAMPLPSATLVAPTEVDEASSVTLNLTNLVDFASNDVSTLRFSFSTDGGATFAVTNSASASYAIPASLTGDGARTLNVVGRVTDALGASSTYTGSISVRNVAPTAAIDLQQTSVAAGTVVASVGSATDPSVADTTAGFAYAWTVSRGASVFATGTGINFSFTPDLGGDYIVALTARDKDLATSLPVTRTVTVAGPTDPTAPSIQLLPVPAPTVGASSVDLTFALTDSSGIDTSTVVAGLVTITEQGGGTVQATLVGTGVVNGVTLATYRYTPTSGTVVAGGYDVAFNGSAVRDQQGNTGVVVASTFSVAGVTTPRAGRLDPAFGISGTTTQLFAGLVDGRLLDSAAQGDGTTLVLGLSGTDELVLARLTAGGVLDGSFAAGGYRRVALPAGFEGLSASFDLDGKIIVTGNLATVEATPAGPAVLRLNADATVDTTFGTAGVVRPGAPANTRITSPIDGETTILAARTLAGRRGIIVVGRLETGGARLFVARLRVDGSLDTSFGRSGVFTLAASGADVLSSVAISPTGDILAGGTLGGQAVLVRLGATGRVAARTPSTGRVLLTAPGSGYAAVDRIVVDGRNRVVLSVSTAANAAAAEAGQYGAAVFRLGASLTPETTFTDGANQAGAVVLVANPTAPSVGAPSTNVGFEEVTRSKVLLTRRPAGGLLSVVTGFAGDAGIVSRIAAQQEDTTDVVALSATTRAVTVRPGARVTATAQVRIDGSIPANGRFVANLILTTDGTLAGSVGTLSTTAFTLSNVAAGTVRTLSLRGTLSQALANGVYRLLVQIVPEGTNAVTNDLSTNDTALAVAAVTVQG